MEQHFQFENNKVGEEKIAWIWSVWCLWYWRGQCVPGVPSAILSLISPIQRSIIVCCHWYEQILQKCYVFADVTYESFVVHFKCFFFTITFLTFELNQRCMYDVDLSLHEVQLQTCRSYFRCWPSILIKLHSVRGSIILFKSTHTATELGKA